MYIKQIEVGPMKNFSYAVGDSASKQVWIIDPAWNVEDVLNAVQADGMQPAGILISHAHFDHCNALERVLARAAVPVYAHAADVELSRADSSGLFGDLALDAVRPVSPGDVLTLGETRLTCLHTPGHTPGSLCFSVGGRLFSGDTLFLGGCGRCDLPGGDARALDDSLNRVIAKLPDETIVMPGHDYHPQMTSDTLANQKAKNPYFRTESVRAFRIRAAEDLRAETEG